VTLDLQGLNDRQREAVVYGDGPLVVFAGAGSGKTRVITHRVAHLVAERRVKPWRILAVTFTNKAAAEMRERLQLLVPDGGARDLWVGTFHATCARLLRRYGEPIGVRKDFVIYDDADQRSMITRILRDLNLDERRYPPRMLASIINRAKNEAVSADEFAQEPDHEQIVKDVYASYEQRMSASSALDFGDLIFRLVHGMRQEPALLAELQSRFDHLLVDEYQDTNRVQYLLLRAFADQHRNLCVVGDDDQSIYRFRGADRRNILEFSQQFPGAHVVKLEQNYRSTQRILRVANSVVRNNLAREPKTLWTDNEEGSKVALLRCSDERDEAALVIKLAQMLLENGNYARRDLALLYRTHAQSRVFEEALRFANMPYRVVGGLRFYDRAEVKDLLAYLRVVHNPDDDVSLLRIINTPARGIGKTTIERLLEDASRHGGSVWKALHAAGQDPAHNAGARKSLEKFRGLMVALRELSADGAGPATLAREVLARTGYVQSLQAEDSVEADARIENLNEVLGSMVEFEREAEEPTVARFLELVTLQTDADRGDDSKDSVTLMTVHAAKGLEFPVVMVAGLEEETFPHKGLGEDDEPEDLEEERRLAYVAFTRARQRLFLSYAEARRVYGELRYRRRSRFLDEIPGAELELIGETRPARAAAAAAGLRHGQGGWSAPRQRGSGSWPPVAPRQPALAPRTSSAVGPAAHEPRVDRSESDDGGEGIELRLGMRVRHAKYGIGDVIEVRPGLDPKANVLFPGWGMKLIVARFLEPA
jgi:DNA helicase II / ATP-dependent DNA helicase PcrA